MVISTKAREKCLAEARKRVKHQEKWGWLDAILEFAVAAGSFAGVGYILYLIATRLMAIDGQNQAAQDAVKEGWAVGVVVGLVSGSLVFAGTAWLIRGIRTLRGGDTASHILVEYHDVLESPLHRESEEP
jgi:hypothetical protein